MPMTSNGYQDALKRNQDSLALDYLPALKTMAFRLKERLPASVDFSDLISIGTEELIKLARKYDNSLNDSFWGYARPRVQGAMLDYLRSLDPLSRNMRTLVKRIEKEIAIYYNEHQEEPDNAYLSKLLGENEEKSKKREWQVKFIVSCLLMINLANKRKAHLKVLKRRVNLCNFTNPRARNA